MHSVQDFSVSRVYVFLCLLAMKNTKKKKNSFDGIPLLIYNFCRTLSQQEVGKMDRKEVFATVSRILSDKLGVKESQIKEDSKLIDDLGADSLDLVDLVMALEEELGVKIADDKLQKISTVKDVVDYIVKAKG